jgi:hypothetical protein
MEVVLGNNVNNANPGKKLRLLGVPENKTANNVVLGNKDVDIR